MKPLAYLLLIICTATVIIGCSNQAQTIAEVATSAPITVAPTDPPPPPTETLAPTPTNTLPPPPTFTLEPTATNTLIPTETPTPLPTETPTPPPTATLRPTVTPAPTETPTEEPFGVIPSGDDRDRAWQYINYGSRPAPRPGAAASPGSPTPYLSRYQLITFYGSPWGRGLGILGNNPVQDTIRLLWGMAEQYQHLDSRHAMATYHMVTTVANQSPPDYRHHVETSVMEVWIANANNNEAAVIIDIQPGHADLMDEFNRVKGFLYNPHVHLALDPEFLMRGEQIPNVHIGRITAEEINMVQAEMNQIALEMGVNRVLIIHQFKDSMVENIDQIINYPHVELVIDADGAFDAGAKMIGYSKYANQAPYDYGGIKIFFEYDDRVIPPEEIMTLSPRPAIIIYQ